MQVDGWRLMSCKHGQKMRNNSLHDCGRLDRAAARISVSVVLYGDGGAGVSFRVLGRQSLQLVLCAQDEFEGASVKRTVLMVGRVDLYIFEDLQPSEPADAFAALLYFVLRERRPKRAVVIIIEAYAVIRNAKPA